MQSDQQVSLAYLALEGAMIIMMLDLGAMLSFLSSLQSVTEGCDCFTSLAYLFVCGEGKGVCVCVLPLLETADYFFL